MICQQSVVCSGVVCFGFLPVSVLLNKVGSRKYVCSIQIKAFLPLLRLQCTICSSQKNGSNFYSEVFLCHYASKIHQSWKVNQIGNYLGGEILNSKGLYFVMLLKMYVRLHLANLVLWSNRIPRYSFCWENKWFWCLKAVSFQRNPVHFLEVLDITVG